MTQQSSVCHFTNLPVEVFERILSYVDYDRSTIIALKATSPHFVKRANSIIFSSLDNRVKDFYQLCGLLVDKPELAGHLTRLTTRLESEVKRPTGKQVKTLKTLLSLAQNLATITVSGSRSFELFDCVAGAKYDSSTPPTQLNLNFFGSWNDGYRFKHRLTTARISPQLCQGLSSLSLADCDILPYDVSSFSRWLRQFTAINHLSLSNLDYGGPKLSESKLRQVLEQLVSGLPRTLVSLELAATRNYASWPGWTNFTWPTDNFAQLKRLSFSKRHEGVLQDPVHPFQFATLPIEHLTVFQEALDCDSLITALRNNGHLKLAQLSLLGKLPWNGAWPMADPPCFDLESASIESLRDIFKLHAKSESDGGTRDNYFTMNSFSQVEALLIEVEKRNIKSRGLRSIFLWYLCRISGKWFVKLQ